MMNLKSKKKLWDPHSFFYVNIGEKNLKIT